MIRAILRAQWLSMRMFRLASGRRGAAISLITALLWYGFWAFLALAAARLAASPALRAAIAEWLPVALLAVFGYWQLMPLASATLGSSLDLRKLLLYPVPRDSLFLVELLLRLTNCGEMLLLMAGIAIGLVRNPAFGAWRGLPRVFAAMLVFAAFNILLSAGLRSLIERWLSRRVIREVVALVMMLCAVLPRLFLASGTPIERLQPLFPAGRGTILPWTAAARFMVASSAGMLPAALTLAAWTVLAYLFGRWQFARGLRAGMQEVQAEAPSPRRRAFAGRLYRLPSLLLPDPLGALIENELRSLARTPRFRLVFVMGFSFGPIVWLPMTWHAQNQHSAISDNILIVVSVYAVTLLGQVTFWNAFGFDRSAAQLYFAAPVGVGQVLAAKNITAALFIFLEITAVSCACFLLRLNASSPMVAEAFIVAAISALYLMGIGNLSSVNYPRAMSPHRVSSGSAAGRTQGLLFLFYPVALLPVFLAYLARYAFSSDTVFYVMLAGAGALGAAIYWMSTASAITTALTRRETIVAELSRGEGPMTAE